MPKQRIFSHRITRSNALHLQRPKERCCICYDASYGVHFYHDNAPACNHGRLHCHTCAKKMFARNHTCSLCRNTVTNVNIEDVRCKKCNAITRGVSMVDGEGNEICDHGLELCHACVKHASKCPLCEKPFEKMKRIHNFTVKKRQRTLLERIVNRIEEMSEGELIEFLHLVYIRMR